jgi:hypothetical protein
VANGYISMVVVAENHRRKSIPHVTMRSTGRWLIFLVVLLVLSSAAVAVRASVNQELVPPALAYALRQFVEPGVSLWWLTMSSLFQSFPYTVSGYIAVVVGNTVFWLAVAGILVLLVKVTHCAANRLQR